MGKPNLSSLIDDIKVEKAYASESGITDARLVRVINVTQNELAQAIYEGDPYAFSYYIEYSAAASATLPPTMRKLQHVEHRASSGDTWNRVPVMDVRAKDGFNDTNQTPSAGTFRVNYSRIPAALSYGTASSATATTLVLAETPTYGETSSEDDYYNGCTVKIISGTTGANCTAICTDYVGSSRTMTITFSTTPTGTIVYNIETDIPEDYAYQGLINGTIAKLTRDPQATNEFQTVQMKLQAQSAVNNTDYPSIDGFDFENGRTHVCYRMGRTIYFYKC